MNKKEKQKSKHKLIGIIAIISIVLIGIYISSFYALFLQYCYNSENVTMSSRSSVKTGLEEKYYFPDDTTHSLAFIFFYPMIKLHSATSVQTIVLKDAEYYEKSRKRLEIAEKARKEREADPEGAKAKEAETKEMMKRIFKRK